MHKIPLWQPVPYAQETPLPVLAPYETLTVLGGLVVQMQWERKDK